MPRRRAPRDLNDDLDADRADTSPLFDAPVVVEMAPPPSPADEPPEELSLIALQHREMRNVFRQAGISLASYAAEVVAVARAAAAQGEYAAAGQLYKIVGQHIGALTDQPAQHVHLHAADGRPADLRGASDNELRALIARARAEVPAPCLPTTTQPAEVLSIRNTPETR